MTATILPSQIPDALEAILKDLDSRARRRAEYATKTAARNVFGEIVEGTPVGDFDPEHEGTLRANWQITSGRPAVGQLNRRQPNRNRSDLTFPAQLVPGETFLTNNMPYAGVVEYGGYPRAVRLGTYNKRTGEFEIRSSGGFSKQAPAGMVRVNTRRWRREVKQAAKQSMRVIR